MKPIYLNTLNELTEQAKDEIRNILCLNKEIILFEPDEEDEWTRDIYDEIPDFAFTANTVLWIMPLSGL